MQKFESEKWGAPPGPLWRHLDTEQVETGFEQMTSFASADVIGDLLALLFDKGILNIEELRQVTGNKTLTPVEEPSCQPVRGRVGHCGEHNQQDGSGDVAE